MTGSSKKPGIVTQVLDALAIGVLTLCFLMAIVATADAFFGAWR